MRGRYEGEQGKRRLVEQMRSQRVVMGSEEIARAFVEAGTPVFPDVDETIIEQGATTNDAFFVVSGHVDLIVYGRKIGQRQAGRTVGEMSAINPTIARSATVRAGANTVLIKVTEPELTRLAEEHPDIWRRFAIDLSERLEERNVDIKPCNELPKVFVICASEALMIANTIQFAFDHEAIFKIWSNEVFRASQYPLESLADAIEEADFAIAIASPEDIVRKRGSEVSIPRDNVLVELGMSIGKLGRERSMVLVPRRAEVELPSDFKGLNLIPYKDGDDKDLAALLGPACHQIRAVIRAHGVRTNR